MIEVEYKFYPIGQGLFSSGHLSMYEASKKDKEKRIHWVYDCGTSSDGEYLKTSIQKLKYELSDSKLDMVVISHFHNDHINGIVELLNTIGTDVLLIPWAPLWYRLVVCWSQGINSDDPFFEFYIDPVEYLIRHAGEGFKRIVFVQPSNDDGEIELRHEVDPEFDPLTESSKKIDSEEDLHTGISFEPEVREVDTELKNWEAHVKVNNPSNEVKPLRMGTGLKVRQNWKFIPYHSLTVCPRNKTVFIQEVNTIRKKLLDGDNKSRKATFKKLKSKYKNNFANAKAHKINLFLYGGPVEKYRLLCWRLSDQHWQAYEPMNGYNGSILYTGDGLFKKDKTWELLCSVFTPLNSVSPSVLQVAHHGSSKNWFGGLAELIKPLNSVFCSDPARPQTYHPHKVVLLDFVHFQPRLVDKNHGFSVKFFLAEKI